MGPCTSRAGPDGSRAVEKCAPVRAPATLRSLVVPCRRPRRTRGCRRAAVRCPPRRRATGSGRRQRRRGRALRRRQDLPGRPPVTALAGVDLAVRRGELFGLLGPNGAGKSTTVGICTTRIRPTAGSVRVEDVDVVRRPAAAKRRLGVVTQDNTLDRSLTLWEDLYHHQRYFGIAAAPARRRADELLERFRLTGRASGLPRQISGGMAQRLQIARAVSHDPAVLFLDEPTAGLDPQSRLLLWTLVRELQADGLTIVLTTHHLEEAERLCERVAIVDHGQVLVCDRPEVLQREHGTGMVVELRLDGAVDDALVTALGRLDGVVAVDRRDDGLRVRAEDRDHLVGEVVAVVAGQGLTDLSVSRSSLEGVFIALTGRDLRE
nr:ABC transporter ATP-binding protein [Egicoccus halophilus]